MNKSTTYVDGIHGEGTRRKLSSTRRLAESLLEAVEGEEFAGFQGQSMDALKSLLRVLSEAIRAYERGEPDDGTEFQAPVKDLSKKMRLSA
jgi:hypothetical protein